jgi:hypothetical protein
MLYEKSADIVVVPVAVVREVKAQRYTSITN